MQKVILYIQPQLRNTTVVQDFVQVDLMESDLITLTQVIQDVRSIDKVFTDFSKTFNLPASKTNNKIFKYWYNPDVEGFDNQVMANARIELNHFAFKEGKIRLESVTMRNNQPSIYKVTFFGNTVKLNDLIGQDKLQNLVWLNNFNHEYSNGNIKNGLQFGLNFSFDSVLHSDAIIYPLIAHSQQYVYDSVGTTLLTGTATSSSASKLVDDSENFTNVVSVGDVVKNTTDNTTSTVSSIDSNTELTLNSDIMSNGESYTIIKANGLNIYASGENLGNRGVFTEDLKPAILVKHIIKAIEEQYSLTFKTSEFFDSTAMDNFYMWLHRNKGNIVQDYFKTVDDQTFTCVNNPLSTTNACVFFANGVAPQYTSGVYEFVGELNDGVSNVNNFTTEVTPTNITDIYTIEIVDIVNDTVVATLKDTTGVQTINAAFCSQQDATTFNSLTNPININEGQTVKLATRIKTNSTFQFSIVNTIFSSKFDTSTSPNTIVLHQAEYTSNSSSITTIANLIITEQIPDIKVLDFLNGLFKMFNLTSFVNFDGEIVVQKLDDFYSGGDTIDITEYIKTDEHSVNNTIPFSEVDLEYSEPKSILAQRFLNTNNRKYGEVEYKTNASDKKIYKVTAPFEHMLFSRLSDLTSGNFTDVQTGCFLDEELNPSIGMPLLFYGIYRTNISTPINVVFTTRPEVYGALADTTGLNFNIDDYWMPHHANELGGASTPPSINLNFGSEIDTYNLTDYGGNNNSLFQLNYEDYITRVFNKKTRIFKYKAVIPLKILLQFTLDDKVIVGTRIFTINSMTTKLQSGETELELLNEAP